MIILGLVVLWPAPPSLIPWALITSALVISVKEYRPYFQRSLPVLGLTIGGFEQTVGFLVAGTAAALVIVCIILASWFDSKEGLT